MDLRTDYLGMSLNSPLVPSASPLSRDVSNLRKMEDAGAGAVVLHSLFEEQIKLERSEFEEYLTRDTESHAEALTYFTEPSVLKLGPEEYLDHVRKAKAALSVPIIASLNAASMGGWTDYARQIESAGADALELNVYFIPTDPDEDSARVEQVYVDVLSAVKAAVGIPVAVKLSPFFSNVAFVARRLEQAGAAGLVLFNRFYQPDIDLDALDVKPTVELSTPRSLRIPLRWIAILSPHLKADLAASGGIHDAQGALKAVLAGAKVAMLCSALLEKGINHLKVVAQGMREWMEEREYASIHEMRGSMSQKNIADPSVFERVQYMKAIAGFGISD